MTTARRIGGKGRGRVAMSFDEPGRPDVELTAFEVRLAYRRLYQEGTGKRRRARADSEIERSNRASGVPE